MENDRANSQENGEEQTNVDQSFRNEETRPREKKGRGKKEKKTSEGDALLCHRKTREKKI
jgi:hypothetical protein